jgi:DNA-binding IclR family transcriptional regulator
MPGNDLLKSVLRAVDVLDAVARSPDGLTLQDLALGLRVRVTTLHNLLRTLVSREMLELSPRGRRYRLGSHFFDLARACYDDRLLAAVEQSLRNIREACDAETIWFAGGSPTAVTALYRLSRSHPHWLQRPGQRLHPYTNICSLVFQAFWSPAERTAFRRTYPFSIYGKTAWEEEDRLDTFLAESRRQGHAELTDSGIVALGRPIFRGDGSIVGALGAHLTIPVSGRETGSFPDGARDALRVHAARLQEVLRSGDILGFPWEGQLHCPLAQAPVSGPDGRRTDLS